MPDTFPIGTESLVLIVGVLLYLTDLGHLLYANEIVLVGSLGGPWSVTRPTNGIRMSRRAAVFPRFYDPGIAIIRMVSPGSVPTRRKSDRDLRAEVDRRLGMLRTPAWICRLLLIEIFLGIPIAYVQPERSWPLLGIFVLVYGQALFLSAWLLVRRKELGLTLKPGVLLIFESIVCIPYAINFHRKLARHVLKTTAASEPDLAAALLSKDMLRDIDAAARDVAQRDGRQRSAADRTTKPEASDEPE